jgi:hypothetical protein
MVNHTKRGILFNTDLDLWSKIGLTELFKVLDQVSPIKLIVEFWEALGKDRFGAAVILANEAYLISINLNVDFP